MTEGLLWFDNDKTRSFAEKVKRAGKYYEEKYHNAPNVCYVHISQMPESKENKPIVIANMEIRTLPTVLLNHFWLGIKT